MKLSSLAYNIFYKRKLLYYLLVGMFYLLWTVYGPYPIVQQLNGWDLSEASSFIEKKAHKFCINRLVPLLFGFVLKINQLFINIKQIKSKIKSIENSIENYEQFSSGF